MMFLKTLACAACSAVFCLIGSAVWAADFPVPREGSWVVRDFRFHTGETLPDLRLNYTTVGEPTGEPVLVLHGTTGSGAGTLTPGFGGELFGPGQALDARRYYVILPDAIGTGKSSKPSDGLRAKFPQYNYDDMVDAQYRLVKEHLGVKHLRLVIGNSMGGMQPWIWGAALPRVHGRAGADGLAAYRNGEPQLDHAPPYRRFDSQRPGVDERQLHQAAQERAIRFGVLCLCKQRRHAGALQGGAYAREGRPVAQPVSERAVRWRRE